MQTPTDDTPTALPPSLIHLGEDAEVRMGVSPPEDVPLAAPAPLLDGVTFSLPNIAALVAKGYSV